MQQIKKLPALKIKLPAVFVLSYRSVYAELNRENN